jgi:chromate transporter
MSAAVRPAVSLREALSYWSKLVFVSFDGPAGQISLMHSDLVDRVLPGPEAQQLATYIGWLMRGTGGGIVAGVLFVAPSLVVSKLVSSR